jgi:hypothetical protein
MDNAKILVTAAQGNSKKWKERTIPKNPDHDWIRNTSASPNDHTIRRLTVSEKLFSDRLKHAFKFGAVNTAQSHGCWHLYFTL